MLIKVQEAYRTLSGLGQKRKSPGHTIIKAKCTEQSENTKSCKGKRASNIKAGQLEFYFSMETL